MCISCENASSHSQWANDNYYIHVPSVKPHILLVSYWSRVYYMSMKKLNCFPGNNSGRAIVLVMDHE